jgi:hypothetical protein
MNDSVLKYISKSQTGHILDAHGTAFNYTFIKVHLF